MTDLAKVYGGRTPSPATEESKAAAAKKAAEAKLAERFFSETQRLHSKYPGQLLNTRLIQRALQHSALTLCSSASDVS